MTRFLAAMLAAFLLPSLCRADGMGDPIRGQTLFVSKGCVACHAVRGAGGRIGPDLGRTAVKGSFYELAAALWNHSGAMTDKMAEFRLVRPSFEQDELRDLLAFLYFLNYFDEPGDATAGKTLFAEMHCIRCHQVGREGGSAGPTLDTMPRSAPPLGIAQALWNHGPRMVDAIQRMGLRIPTFQGTQILDLFAYIRSQGRGREARSFTSAGDSVKGSALFSTKGCARCHAVFRQGKLVGPDLGASELSGSVTILAGRMWNHWSEMTEAMTSLGMKPPTFAREELADLFAYIFVSRYDGHDPNGVDGKTVYLQKGCGTCHAADGEGDIGPPLREILQGEPKETLMQRLWNHSPGMRERMADQRIPWPRLEPRELAALLAFLGSDWGEEREPRDGKRE